MSNSHTICTRCVMDTTDPRITFDDDGVCDHCITFDSEIAPHWSPEGLSDHKLLELGEAIKKRGRGQDFDCLIGMSGGIDSSYLLHLAVKKMQLRPPRTLYR